MVDIEKKGQSESLMNSGSLFYGKGLGICHLVYMEILKKAGVVYYSGGKNTGGYYLSNHILRE